MIIVVNREASIYAFIQFFGAGGELKEAELQKLKSNDKLKTIFHAIYDKNLM